MSSYGGLDLFGSGPERWSVAERGLAVQPLSRLFDNPGLAGSQPIGDVELEVVVIGRLIAATEAALWTLREAVVGQAKQSVGAKTLVDGRGRSFAAVRLIVYTEEDRVDRGRVWSIGYEARFRNFTSDPG
jgi:hypothetical protein